VADEVLARSEQLMLKQGMGNPVGELEFNALVRTMDRIDPSYKD